MLLQSSRFFIILIQLWSLLFSLYIPISTSIALEDRRIKNILQKRTLLCYQCSLSDTAHRHIPAIINTAVTNAKWIKPSKFFYFNTQKSQKNVAGCGLFVEWSPRFCKERTLLVHSLMYFLVRYIVYYSCVVCIYTWEKSSW